MFSYEIGGTNIGSLDIVGLVAIFVYGKKSQKNDLGAKR